jgi:hypothetical protein
MSATTECTGAGEAIEEVIQTSFGVSWSSSKTVSGSLNGGEVVRWRCRAATRQASVPDVLDEVSAGNAEGCQEGVHLLSDVGSSCG